MPNPLLTLALGLVAQAAPFAEEQVYTEQPGYNPVPQSYVNYGIGGAAEQRWPFDAPHAWTHGYIQHIPAYGGFSSFRPYNYKHVMPQAQTSSGWGMSATMPYSQQYWHRYEERARNLKDANESTLPTAEDTSDIGRSPGSSGRGPLPSGPSAPVYPMPAEPDLQPPPDDDIAPPPLDGSTYAPSTPPRSAAASQLSIPYRR